MIMNSNKLRTYMNVVLNTNNVLLRITSADSAPSRNGSGD